MVNGLCGPSLLRCFVLVSLVHHVRSANDKNQHDTTDSESIDDTENSLTCYTCVNVSDNLMCNRFAIDHPCPKGEDFCHTLHIMDSTGASVVVNKKCADSSECWPLGVGCVLIDSQTVCVSCCDEMYCNVTVPTNKSTATFSSKRTHRRQRPRYPPSGTNTNHEHNSCPPNAESAKQTVLLYASAVIVVLCYMNVL